MQLFEGALLEISVTGVAGRKEYGKKDSGLQFSLRKLSLAAGPAIQ
jgi:hypothetical protein